MSKEKNVAIMIAIRLLEIKNISIGQKTDINSIHKIILLLQKPAYYNFITIKTLYCLIFI